MLWSELFMKSFTFSFPTVNFVHPKKNLASLNWLTSMMSSRPGLFSYKPFRQRARNDGYQYTMKSILHNACTLVLIAVSNSSVHAQQTPVKDPDIVKPRYSIVSRDVFVGQGDTLASIAKRELGTTKFSQLLGSYNRLTPTSTLKPGDIVRIPIHVPPRGEYAEVVFVKGELTAERDIKADAEAADRQASASTAQTDGFSRDSELLQQTEIISLTRNDKVFEGDLLKTAPTGFASIAFSSGSVVNLQPDTTAILEKLVCLESDDSCVIGIETLSGRVTSNIQSRDQQPTDFTITTPFASAAVRGTFFDIDASEDFLVSVAEGAVDVQAQDTMVPVGTGFGVVVEQGSAPGEPIELMPAPVFKRVPPRMVEGDTIEWFAFEDASSYEATLSTDEASNQTVTDIDVSPGSESLDLQASLANSTEPAPAAGDYFLSVRAIDVKGLLGIKTTTRITLAELDSSIQPVSTNIVRDGSEFLVTVENPPEDAPGYEIQISADESFQDPLSADVNALGAAVFRVEQDQVFARARVLVDPLTVSAFGDVSSN